MNFETAKKRLFNHANLPQGPADAPDQQSLLFILSDARRSNVAPAALSSLRRDVIDCLEVVNRELNGALPSNTFGGKTEIERDAAYAVSRILHGCWDCFLAWRRNDLFTPEARRELAYCAWSISFAWTAVLAGDIDSLHEEVETAGSVSELF